MSVLSVVSLCLFVVVQLIFLPEARGSWDEVSSCKCSLLATVHWKLSPFHVFKERKELVVDIN